MWLCLRVHGVHVGCGVTMLTQHHVLILDAGDSTVLECSFKSSRYNMFDYPVIWRKQQLHEWTQINVMGSVNEPFVSSSNRFELSFTATPPYYLIQLSIQGSYSPEQYLGLLAVINTWVGLLPNFVDFISGSSRCRGVV